MADGAFKGQSRVLVGAQAGQESASWPSIFYWNELFATLRALQVLPIDALIILRLDLSTAMRTCGVGGRLNLLQISGTTAGHL